MRFARAVCLSVLSGLLLGGCAAREAAIEVIDAAALGQALERHRGKVVLVDFWATWCVPCTELFPHTVELSRRFADQGLVVISVSMDDPDNLPAVRQFLTRQGATFPNFLSRDGAGPRSFETFGIDDGALPHFRLYDRQGSLLRKFLGGAGIDPRQIDRAVEGAMAPSRS